MSSSKKTAIYIRLSSEDEMVDGSRKKESDSVSSQRILLQNFASEKLGMLKSEILEYVDDGVSGTHFNRQGFQNLQEDMKAGLIDCVIVKDFSRFGRDYLEVGFYLEYIFPLLQIRFISVNDNYDSITKNGMTGGMNVALKNIINNMYSRDLSRKIMSAMEVRTKNGTRLPVSAKYGYRKGKDGKLVVDPESASVVKRIFRMAADGMSFAEITRVLNDEGVLTIEEYMKRNGKKLNFQQFDTIKKKYWSPTTVASIVREELYLGVRIWGKTRNNMHTGHKAVANDESEWIRLENNHDAIITQELFDAANRLHPHRKKERSESRKSHVLPRKEKQPALLICGHCGRSMFEETNRILKCSAVRSGGSPVCRELSIQKEELEQTILEYIRKYASSMLNEKKRRIIPSQEIEPVDPAEIQISMKRLSLSKMKFYDDYKDGLISKEDYKREAENISQELIAYQEKLDKLAAARKEIPEQEKESIRELEEISVLQTFDKEILRKIIRVIRVYSQYEIEIEWKFNDELNQCGLPELFKPNHLCEQIKNLK